MLGTCAGVSTQSWNEAVVAMVGYGEQFGLKIIPDVRPGQSGFNMSGSPVTGSINRTTGESSLVLSKTPIDHRITANPAFWGWDL